MRRGDSNSDSSHTIKPFNENLALWLKKKKNSEFKKIKIKLIKKKN